ncbi:MAG TPA: acyltransferase [Anaerolineae bacterium]|nr:acyltransferase [Anaerolineae bacterium]
MDWLKQIRYLWWLQRRRWRAKRLARRLGACGPELSLEGRVFFSRPRQVHIGTNVHLGDRLWAQTAGGLFIGNNVIVSRNCTIHTVNHDVQIPDALPYSTAYIYQPVHIEDNVWIGMNVLIAPGSRIGEGAVIGMGAVVAGEIPPLAIAVGNPARAIKYRNKDTYERPKRERKWLRNIRGIPAAHGWRPGTALARWGVFLRTELERKGYVTTQQIEEAGAKFAAALLYQFSQHHPDLRFAHYEAGYMVYDADRAMSELKSSDRTSIPLEQEEITRLRADLSEGG